MIDSIVAKKKLGEETVEVLAEGDIKDLIIENGERCQDGLMLLEESLFNMEDFRNKMSKEKVGKFWRNHREWR